MGKIAAVVSFEEHWSGQGELLPGKGFVVRRLSPFATCKGDLCGSTESMGVFTRPLIMTPCCRGQLLFKIQVDLNCLFGLAVYAHYLDPNYFFTLLGLPFCEEKHSFQPPLRAATAHQVEWNTVSPTMCQNVLLTRPLAHCDDVIGGYLVRRDVHHLSIHGNGLVAYQLARFRTSAAEPHTVDDIVEAPLEELQQVLARGALMPRCRLVVVTKLALENAVDETQFLLLAQL